MVLSCSTDSSDTTNGGGSSGNAQPAFKSGTIAPAGQFSYTFEQEGTVEYFCDIHSPDMQGEVVVSTGAYSTGQDTVEMINTQFSPSQVTVAPNTQIIWINRDNKEHTVVEGNPSSNNDGGDDGYY